MHRRQILGQTKRGAVLTSLVLLLVGLCAAGTTPAPPEVQKLNDLLARTADQTAAFLDQFSEVKCTEQVRQEKLGKDDKV